MPGADLKDRSHWPVLNVVVAGGGTGGHLFPGIAVARSFAGKNRNSRVLFVGAGRPLEKEVLQRAGFPHRTIAIEGIKGKRLGAKMGAIMKIPKAVFRSVKILSDIKADLVVAVGGYAAGPVAVAAWLKKTPVVICEQNTVPGITNRLLFPIAKRIYLSFENTRGKIDPSKKRITGNPIRKTLLESVASEKKEKGKFTVLIVGGSQGAHAINQTIMDAVPLIRNPDKICFIHQTGAADREVVQSAYEKLGLDADVNAFFHDMATCYSRADLVICRSGATTIAELTALGKAALFIPYPFAADNHQEVNAQTLVDLGAAKMVLEKEMSGSLLANMIDQLADHPEVLSAMASRSTTLGKPEAAQDIVNDCYQLLENNGCT